MILLDPLARVLIAHRGASGHFPENTMAAFAGALSRGADAFELDVRCSADHVPVVIHDETVDRTTDGTGPVAAMSATELARLDAGGGERVPTLADVLRTFATVPIIVELKTGDWRRVFEVANQFDHRRLVFGGFAHPPLRALRRAGAWTTASRRDVVRFWTLTRLGLRPRPRAYHAFSVPEYAGRRRVVTDAFVRNARRAGVPVHVWTVDDAAVARRLWEMGVSGVLTNYPERLRALAS